LSGRSGCLLLSVLFIACGELGGGQSFTYTEDAAVYVVDIAAIATRDIVLGADDTRVLLVEFDVFLGTVPIGRRSRAGEFVEARGTSDDDTSRQQQQGDT